MAAYSGPLVFLVLERAPRCRQKCKFLSNTFVALAQSLMCLNCSEYVNRFICRTAVPNQVPWCDLSRLAEREVSCFRSMARSARLKLWHVNENIIGQRFSLLRHLREEAYNATVLKRPGGLD